MNKKNLHNSADFWLLVVNTSQLAIAIIALVLR